jgi:diacylglycerol kinase family enzyme
MIAVLINPRSRANRRDPRIAAEFQSIVGDSGRVHAPKTVEELDAVVAPWRQAPPAVIAVHGGDGTLHKTVTALGRVLTRSRRWRSCAAEP